MGRTKNKFMTVEISFKSDQDTDNVTKIEGVTKLEKDTEGNLKLEFEDDLYGEIAGGTYNYYFVTKFLTKEEYIASKDDE